MVSLNEQEEGFGVDPTPEEIRVRSLAVRKSWSEKTRQKRRVTKVDPWSAPTVTVAEIVASIENN